MSRSCYRLLILYDKPNWAYHQRAKALEKYAPEDFQVTILDWGTFCRTKSAAEECECVFLLDYALTRQVNSSVPGTTPLIVSFNADSRRRQELWSQVSYYANWVVCVSKDRYDKRDGNCNVAYIPNGVDISIYHPRTAIAMRPEKVIALCSSKSAVEKRVDLWWQVKPMLESVGIQCDFRVVDRGTMTSDQMAEWYSSAAWVLNTSSTEGTANTIMEGAACGCCPVTTPTGQFFTECCEPGKNSVVIEDLDPAAIVESLLKTRPDRSHIGAAAMLSVKRFAYRTHAEHYYELFRRMVSGNNPKRAYSYQEQIP